MPTLRYIDPITNALIEREVSEEYYQYTQTHPFTMNLLHGQPAENEIEIIKKEEQMEEQTENKIKTLKKRCSVCGNTIKKIVSKDIDYLPQNFGMKEYQKNGKIHYICKDCEQNFKLTGDYFIRGYGYAGSTVPRRTSADKHSTPTYGVEIEVAGNIKSIKKIADLISPTHECTIGYDTSVEGAQFELSYAPGTYYWYLYESKFKPVLQLLQKDEWVNKNSTTTGMHIHVGMNTEKKMMVAKALYKESLYEPITFWHLIRMLGERDFNQYCSPHIGGNHHYAISLSRKWNTLEFRIFRTTFDFDTVMNRMKFIRQIIDNSTEMGVEWHNIRQDSKDWFMKLINKSRMSKEIKANIVWMFETPLEQRLEEHNTEAEIQRINGMAEDFVEHQRNYEQYYDEDEEHNEEHEEEVW